MAASAFVWLRDEPREAPVESPLAPVGEAVGGASLDTKTACDEVFTITANREPSELGDSFRAWLDRAIDIGLETWRRRL